MRPEIGPITFESNHYHYHYIAISSLPMRPNNQLNVCTTSVTEGEVARVKLV